MPITLLKKIRKQRSGFTLIELLITIAILATLIILSLMAWQKHLDQAHDAQRKSDLKKISIAFENYYNDKECFPEETILQACGDDSLNPYLNKIPCDPVYNLPYCYIHDPNDSCGQSYKILAPLKTTDDPIIEKLLCHGDLYCGYETNCDTLINPPTGSDYSGFNYGVTSGNLQLYNPDASPPPNLSPSPSPSISPSPSSPSGLTWACDSRGNCNSYDDPVGAGCPIWYEDDQCSNACNEPSNWCP